MGRQHRRGSASRPTLGGEEPRGRARGFGESGCAGYLPGCVTGESNAKIYWVLGGCGAVLLLGICALGGLAVWVAVSSQGDDDLLATPEPPLPLPGDPATGDPLPPPSGMHDPFGAEPRMVRAVVTRVDGSRPVEEGEVCSFAVERRRVQGGAVLCQTQVVCGGKLLYGGANAGYFPCTMGAPPEREVVGREDHTTREDQDAAFHIDTRDRRIAVRDDATGAHGAYSLEARVTETP